MVENCSLPCRFNFALSDPAGFLQENVIFSGDERGFIHETAAGN